MSEITYRLDIPCPIQDLITAHRQACDNECIDGRARKPKSSRELASIEQLKATFTDSITYALTRLIDSGRFERGHFANTVAPQKPVFHAERVLYGKMGLPPEVTFIAKMINRNNESINLSPFGWTRHSGGPVVTQVRAQLEEPLRYKSELLYSEEAFGEELTAIRASPMNLVLGIEGRSFLVESAFHYIAKNSHSRAIYHSGVTSLKIRQTSDESAELIAILSAVGERKVRLTRDPKTAKISVSE